MLNVLLWQKIYFEVGNLIAEREIPMPGWQKIPTLEFYGTSALPNTDLKLED